MNDPHVLHPIDPVTEYGVRYDLRSTQKKVNVRCGDYYGPRSVVVYITVSVANEACGEERLLQCACCRYNDA